MKTALHFGRFLLRADEPSSQVTDRELSLLLEFASEKSVVVELGCYEGRTSAALARATSGTVFSVDPFTPGRLGICYGRAIASLHRRRVGALNLELVRGHSYEVAGRFDRPVDFLFIDADHSYEAVQRDWEDWLPKVVGGGYVAAHDSRPATNSPASLGSMRWYQENLVSHPDLEEVGAVDSLAVFRVRRQPARVADNG